MEKSFVISSDSTCDLYRDYVCAHDIRIVPLHYTMEENGVLHEGVDDFAEYGQYIDFYRRLRAGGFSRTSMLTYDAHCAHFEQLIEGGAREIVHVSLSGGLSPTANVAAQAARDVSAKHPGCRIYPVDSLAATIAQGALVREAVRLRAEGKDAAQTAEAIREIPLHLQYAIIANDLYYLKRGGRVSAIAAAAGTVLKIKPVLSFTREGKLTVLEKCKGMKKAFSRALERMEKLPPVEAGRIIRIVHTDAEEQAEELADLVEARWGTRPEISVMGPVIGSHVGPGSVSMIWRTAQERDDG
ncbi:MAG TPA: DegV family protein [Candidatus Borkfalkia faecigallinarum]|uniref:DegV family protein n=1 Tax=Candidatus Borkfalkia faecigallinarum TaxID=2838509 RepID=A0A9D2AS39_9FIRM|nr:DegV family protein [Candidatus Borkfalkia faecigallinarum]